MPTDFNTVTKVTNESDFNADKDDKWLFTEMRRRVEDRLEIKRMKDELGIEELFFDYRI